MKDQELESLSSLHPHAQVALIVMAGLVMIVFFMALGGLFEKK